jgi:hypothetical protein
MDEKIQRKWKNIEPCSHALLHAQGPRQCRCVCLRPHREFRRVGSAGNTGLCAAGAASRARRAVLAFISLRVVVAQDNIAKAEKKKQEQEQEEPAQDREEAKWRHTRATAQ